MKKLMIAGAAALCATVGFSDVASANIVGYTSQAVPKNQFAMVGVQFTGVTDANGQIALADFITGDFALADYTYPDMGYLTNAPNIQVWSGTGYNKYYFLKSHHPMNMEIIPTIVPDGWCNETGDAAGTAKLSAGQGVWFVWPTGACTITTPGAVAVAEDATFTCPTNQFRMLANYIPTRLDITDANQVEFSGFKAADYTFPDMSYLNEAPCIQVWSGTGYNKYYFLKEHHPMNQELIPVVIPEGWCNETGDALTDANKYIPVGRGFWIIVKHADAETYTVKFKQ